jgi:hypothetical protein
VRLAQRASQPQRQSPFAGHAALAADFAALLLVFQTLSSIAILAFDGFCLLVWAAISTGYGFERGQKSGKLTPC